LPSTEPYPTTPRKVNTIMSLGRTPTVLSRKAIANAFVAGPKRSPLSRGLLSPQVLQAWKAGRRGPFQLRTSRPLMPLLATTVSIPSSRTVAQLVTESLRRADLRGFLSAGWTSWGVAWRSQTAATATEHRARSEYLWSTCQTLPGARHRHNSPPLLCAS